MKVIQVLATLVVSSSMMVQTMAKGAVMQDRKVRKIHSKEPQHSTTT
jgi:hypothetical protein